MRRRVHVYAAKTLRGEGETLHEEWIRQTQKKINWAPATFNLRPENMLRPDEDEKQSELFHTVYQQV